MAEKLEAIGKGSVQKDIQNEEGTQGGKEDGLLWEGFGGGASGLQASLTDQLLSLIHI